MDLVWDLGDAFSFPALARYLEHLPPDGPVARQMRQGRPTLDQLLLRKIEYDVALGAWLQTDTKKNRAAMPKPIPLPGDTKRGGRRRRSGLEYDQLMRQRQAARAAELAALEKQEAAPNGS